MESLWLIRSCTTASRPAVSKRLSSRNLRTLEQRIRYTLHQHLFQRRTYAQHKRPQDGQAPRVAIVGSGPAGFYTARKLMQKVHGTKVDMYEQLPVPFGLVRFGVAPDHPEVKNCQDDFEEVASSPDFTFIGNVQLGQQLPLPILAQHYDAIVFSYGASKDKELGLEGEQNPHVYSARAFVGWYNGLPEYRNLNPDLTAGETAIVVGQGNVALDVARILLSKIEHLKTTDLTEYAIETLSESTIKRVRVVGRRGPLQAAFTIKEVRELIKLEGVNFEPIPAHFFPPDLKKLERPKRRIMELLQKGKPTDSNATKSWSLDFLLAPHSLEWSANDPSTLTGLEFSRTKLAEPFSPSSKVSSTSEKATIPTSLVFRSIGYRAEAIPGMELIGATFDERAGTLIHDGVGRIIPLHAPDHKAALTASMTDTQQQSQAAAQAHASLYCAGWVKRGPTGVIASTMTDAFQTVEAIAEDWNKAVASSTSTTNIVKDGWPGVKAEAEAQGYNLDKVINWEGWHRIDKAEKEAGSQVGKPREKFGSVREMVGAAGIE